MTSLAKTFSKQPADEDFPVALRFLPADKQAALLGFYRLARMADDLADDPHRSIDQRLAGLDALAGQAVDPLARPHLLALIEAFRADARDPLIRSWDDLTASAAGSAVPVGRYLLDLFGEDDDARPAADALCMALQILNHVADCSRDWWALHRVYLPRDWLDAARIFPDQLGGHHAWPALRGVLDRVLDGAAERLTTAEPLPRRLRDPALRLQAAVTLEWAKAHLAQLRRRDPLDERIGVPIPLRLACLGRGLWRVARDEWAVASGSFYWAMRLLPGERRRAMLDLYALARRLDDIADGPGDGAEKLAALDAVRAPSAFDAAEVAHLLDGMRRDARGGRIAPSWDELRLYCRQVAGTIGVMTVQILGRPEARDYALALGEALQLVNILRDRAEDAERGRLYLPRDLLDRHGVPADDPRAALVHPHQARVAADLAARARDAFARAEAALGGDRRGLGAAEAMGAIYRRLLDRLERRGWAVIEPRLELGFAEKLALALWCRLRCPS